MNLPRREFLRALSGAAIGVLGGHATACTHLFLGKRRPDWDSAPPLDGVLDTSAVVRERMAGDLGGHFHREPAAVLRPGSVEDIVKTVRFAGAHGLKLAMRGRGHAPYGQCLVAGGIVVDSRPLDEVRVGSTAADAQPGASWEDVTRATLTRGLMPPVMGDTMTLSVGGILSAGGIGNCSHLAGLVADNVEELDVVTGSGELVTCSTGQSPELFEATLAGMGQCALIVRARLRLVRAPRAVVRRDLDYDSLGPFMADHRRLAADARFEHLGAYVIAREGGGFGFRINAGKFCEEPAQVVWANLLSGLSFKAAAEPRPLAFADYLHREDARNAAALARWRATPTRLFYLTVLVPQAMAEPFLASVVANPADTSGMTRWSLYWLPGHRLNRTMFVRPKDDWVLTMFLFREVAVADESRSAQATAALQDLVARVRSAGGKCYSPHAPFYMRADWQEHYGPELWSRLATAKKHFDPTSVLTPGVGISLAA